MGREGKNARGVASFTAGTGNSTSDFFDNFRNKIRHSGAFLGQTRKTFLYRVSRSDQPRYRVTMPTRAGLFAIWPWPVTLTFNLTWAVVTIYTHNKYNFKGQFCSVLQPSSIRGLATPCTYFLHLSLSFVILINSSTGSQLMSTYWCCPSRLCVVFLATVYLAFFLALSLFPGNSMLASLL